jgi:photosynthetic reaction center H subunit
MLAGIGPGSWANRADRPDVTYEGVPKVVPLRTVPEFRIAQGDIDPRGLPVVGADGERGGTVVDLWLDTPENLFRYLELELDGSGRHVLLPLNFTRVGRNQVKVEAILGRHFADVPGTRQTEVVTMLEEEKIQAYYGGGTLYADPKRGEPLL